MTTEPEIVSETAEPAPMTYAVQAEAPDWNAPRTVAAARCIALGYAAFLAAVRERPDAEIVLRRGDEVLQRMGPPARPA